MVSTTAPFTLKQIGTGTSRFPSGEALPTPTDASVDPYIKTRPVKAVQVECIEFWPQETGTYPGIVLLHEWWGLNSQISAPAWLARAMGSSFPICTAESGGW
jgi:carboxymethylenebutenolidase